MVTAETNFETSELEPNQTNRTNQHSFLKGQNLAIAKEKREEYQIELRKKNRHSKFNQKRYQSYQSSNLQENNDFQMIILSDKSQVLISNQLIINFPEVQTELNQSYVTKFQQIKCILNLQYAKGNNDAPLFCLYTIRKNLTNTKLNYDLQMSLLEAIYEAKLIPIVVEFLKPEYVKYRKEALWVVIGITSGHSLFIRELISFNVISLLINILQERSDLDDMQDSLIALGNIASDSQENRSDLIQQNLFDVIIAIVRSEQGVPPEVLELSLWILWNLLRNKDLEQSFFDTCLKIFHNALYVSVENIIREACQGIKIILQDEAQLDSFFEKGVHVKVVELLENLESGYLQEVISIVAKISEGDDQYAEIIVEIEVVPKLLRILDHFRSNNEIVKEVLFISSNLFVSREKHIQMFMERNFLQYIFEYLESKSKEVGYFSMQVQYEALYCTFHIMHYGSYQQIQYLLQQNLISRVLQFKSEKEFKTISVILDLINLILQKGVEYSQQSDSVDIFLQFDNFGGMNFLNEAENHPNQNISEKATRIIQKYFSTGNVNSNEVEYSSQPLALNVPSGGYNFS